MNTDLLLGLKRTDMDDVRSIATLDSQGSKTFSSRGLEGRNGQSPDTESQESVKSYTFFTRRCRGPAGRKVQLAPQGRASAGIQYWGRPIAKGRLMWKRPTLIPALGR